MEISDFSPGLQTTFFGWVKILRPRHENRCLKQQDTDSSGVPYAKCGLFCMQETILTWMVGTLVLVVMLARESDLLTKHAEAGSSLSIISTVLLRFASQPTIKGVLILFIHLTGYFNLCSVQLKYSQVIIVCCAIVFLTLGWNPCIVNTDCISDCK